MDSFGNFPSKAEERRRGIGCAERGCVNAKLKKMAESCVVEYSLVSLEDEDAEKCLLLFLKSLLLMLMEMI